MRETNAKLAEQRAQNEKSDATTGNEHESLTPARSTGESNPGRNEQQRLGAEQSNRYYKQIDQAR